MEGFSYLKEAYQEKKRYPGEHVIKSMSEAIRLDELINAIENTPISSLTIYNSSLSFTSQTRRHINPDDDLLSQIQKSLHNPVLRAYLEWRHGRTFKSPLIREYINVDEIVSEIANDAVAPLISDACNAVCAHLTITDTYVSYCMIKGGKSGQQFMGEYSPGLIQVEKLYVFEKR
jgi:hypothetical protein